MKTELFKKVYIHSEKDLPKEAGFYFLHWKHTNDRMHTQMGVQYYDESIKGLWFGKGWYDWYLLPVTLPSDEEIERETPAYCGLADEAKAFQAGATWLKSRLTTK